MPAVYGLWGLLFGCDQQKLEPLGWLEEGSERNQGSSQSRGQGEHGPCRGRGRAVPTQELGRALVRGERWLSHGGQLTSRFQCSRDRLVWPVRQVLAQEELRLVATPRWRAIRTLDFPEQNQPGAVARGTGREGKTEEASHGVSVGEQLWEPTSCTSWPSPTPALCLLVWGRGTEDSPARAQ